MNLEEYKAAIKAFDDKVEALALDEGVSEIVARNLMRRRARYEKNNLTFFAESSSGKKRGKRKF